MKLQFDANQGYQKKGGESLKGVKGLKGGKGGKSLKGVKVLKSVKGGKSLKGEDAAETAAIRGWRV